MLDLRLGMTEKHIRASLSIEQCDHLSRIEQRAIALLREKYVTGAMEHGGVLSELPLRDLLVESLKEAVDQVTYLLTAIEKYDEEHGDQPILSTEDSGGHPI